MSARRDATQTPLGREYARLSQLGAAVPEHDTFQATRTVRAADVAVWTADTGGPNLPLGPPDTRPNPVVVGGTVICTAFSPGRVVAFDRSTGGVRWELPLAYYGRSATHGPPRSGLVYGGTSQELLAIAAADGRVAWTFCPYGRTGETIYSAPTAAGGRLFVGDRRGFLHCLDAVTGVPMWRVLTSRAWNDDVNSDPVVAGGVVAVGTNARLAAGYEAATGRPVWRRRLDGPCTRVVPAGAGAALFWTSGSVYRLSVAAGTPLGRWHRRHHAVEHACDAGGRTLVVTRREWGPERLSWPVAELRAYRDQELLFTHTYPRWAGPTVRYDPATRRVYEATAHGLGVLNPRTGVRELAVVTDRDYGRVSLPATDADRLYFLDDGGRVYAIPHREPSAGT